MRGVAFNGWHFHDVPMSARLLHVSGHASVPVADGVTKVLLDGGGEAGGTGFLYHPGKMGRPHALKSRLLAYAVALYDHETVYSQWHVPGPAALVNAMNMATNQDGEQLPDVDLPGELRVYVDPAGPPEGVRIERATGSIPIGYASPGAPFVLRGSFRGGSVDGNRLYLRNLSGAAATAAAVSLHTKPEAARFDLAAFLTSCELDADGAAFNHREIDPVRTGIHTPVPMSAGDEPTLHPVVVDEGRRFLLEENQGLGVSVINKNGSLVPESAYVYARAVIAVAEPDEWERR